MVQSLPRRPPCAPPLEVALVDEGARHPKEACDVGARDQVALHAVPRARRPALAVNGEHDLAQPRVHLLARPAHALAVLRHLEAADEDAAGIRRLPRAHHHAARLQQLDRLAVGRHVGALNHQLHPGCYQPPRVVRQDLVLHRAGKGHVRGDPPRLLAGVERRRLGVAEVLAETLPVGVLQPHHHRQLLLREARRLVHIAARVAQRDRNGAEVDQLLGRVLRNVPAAAHQAALPGDPLLHPVLQHGRRKVHRPVAGRLGPDLRPAPLEALARQRAVEAVAQPPVLAEQVPDLPRADADVARRHVRVSACTAVSRSLLLHPPMCLCSSVMNAWQKALTSLSDLPLGSKSEPPFAPPMLSPVRLFLKICSNPRNLSTLMFTLGWKRSPPL
ncbi:uncharacterized protein BcabD6B2_21810 [Babesia caballi]|uniref:Uncharacterized protein n=1 Tax=Babesia caballi TaxID=5871 RepID=A0AAV4LRF2_BABCB|nr:hypothetical protein BcabD6B2_21810 [Babesia caballi]